MIKNNFFIIKYCLYYMIFTILLFDISIVTSNSLQNPFALHFYLILYFLMFYLGYIFFYKVHKKNKYDVEKIKELNEQKIKKILSVGVYLYPFLSFVSALNFTNSSSLSIFINKVINGLLNPAGTYYAKVSNQLFLNSYLNSLLVVLSPYMMMILVLGLFYFKKMKFRQKMFFAVGIFFEIARWLALGTNKGIFDFLILIICAYLFDRLINNKQKTSFLKKIGKRTKILTVLVIAFSIFTYFISSRMYYSTNDNNSFIKYGIDKISNYIAQGYKGMDYSLSLSWKPTYGVGNSIFLTKQVEEIFHTDIESRTYQKRAEVYGWSSTVNWHTLYSWFANDFSFFGVVFLMFLIGIYFASVIKSIAEFHDYYSMVLFYLIMIGVFYSSANNQVLSFANTFISFWFFFVMRIVRRKKYKKILLGESRNE